MCTRGWEQCEGRAEAMSAGPVVSFLAVTLKQKEIWCSGVPGLLEIM